MRDIAEKARHMRWQRYSVVAIVVAALVALAACSSSGSGNSGNTSTSQPPGTTAPAGPTGSAASSPAAAAFPVTVTSHFGNVTLKSKPTRIVALSQPYVDTLLAFGVQPTAFYQNGQTYPWQKGKLSGKEAPLATLGSTGATLNIEKIAAETPSVIFGDFLVTDKGTYDKLSQIAPTIGPLGDPNTAESWQDIVTTVGKVLGEPAKAAQLIQTTEAKIASDTATVPGIKGETYTLANFFQGQIYLPVSGDGASNLFASLGMKLAPGIVGLHSKQPRIQLSNEQMTLLNGDVFLALADPATKKTITSDPRYATLPSVKKGAVLWMDIPTVSGMNTPSVLSVPYVLNLMLPTLKKGAA